MANSVNYRSRVAGGEWQRGTAQVQQGKEPSAEPTANAGPTEIADQGTIDKASAAINGGPNAEKPVAASPGQLSTEPKTAEEAKELLMAAIPEYAASIELAVGSKERLAALNDLDKAGEKTCLNYILDIAHGEPLANFPEPKLLALELLSIAGNPQSARHGNCYGRTLNAIWTKHHAGEFSRLMAGLADGKVKIANGETVNFSSKSLPFPRAVPGSTGGGGQRCDFMFGTLVNNVRNRAMQDNHSMINCAGYANGGEMANITSRLTGKEHVNVHFGGDLSSLNQILEKYGPSLAEYGCHGGSIAEYKDNAIYSLENGGKLKQKQNLGYAVVPLEAAEEHDLNVMKISAASNNYLDQVLEKMAESEE